MHLCLHRIWRKGVETMKMRSLSSRNHTPAAHVSETVVLASNTPLTLVNVHFNFESLMFLFFFMSVLPYLRARLRMISLRILAPYIFVDRTRICDGSKRTYPAPV